MLKQIFAIILISIAIVMCGNLAHQCMNYLLAAHHWISGLLGDIFTGGPAGSVIRETLALLIIPFLIALIPAAFFYAGRRYFFPHFMDIVWMVWLLEVGALIASGMHSAFL